jgi:hypothetical protein
MTVPSGSLFKSNDGIALDPSLLHDSAMSDEIEELKTTCRNLVAALEADIRLLIQYRPDQILRHSQFVGDRTFNQGSCMDFSRRRILLRPKPNVKRR